jgi:hypothetical protein
MPEIEKYPCGVCGEPVETEWCPTGLLPGPYELLGEVFFHAPKCTEIYLTGFEAACRKSEEGP